MKYILSVFVIILLHLKIHSQLKGNSYQFPEKFSSNYYFNPHFSYNKIKHFKVDGISEKDMEYQKIKNTYGIQESFDNNDFYLEWYDLEDYLTSLVNKILPDTIKKQTTFKVFIRRDPNFKIEVLGNGFIFLNIGTIAICKNEGDLAYLIAHKIYHTVFATNVKISSKYNDIKSDNIKDIDIKLKHFDSIGDDYLKYEIKADSFAFSCLNNSQLKCKNFDYIFNTLHYSEQLSLVYSNRNVSINTRAMLLSRKNDSLNVKLKKQKNKTANQSKRIDITKNYVIDSVFFNKIKKVTTEECKKLCLENGNYFMALRLSFNEYLLGNNSPKNIYNIFETIRKIMYINPELRNKGFLAEELQYTSEFENTNYSILKKPEFLFTDSLDYIKASSHPLIKDEVKPFNTYQDAFFYFTEIGEKLKLNETFFSKALFFYSIKDEANFRNNLILYTGSGAGLYNDLANNMEKYGFPYIQSGKTKILIDYANTSNIHDNYYQSLYRIKYNKDARKLFRNDSNKISLTLYNELTGIQPKLLNEYQRLLNNINSLYSQNDLEKFKKSSYLGKESMDERELKNKYNKNLLILNPEWYKWFTDNNLNGVLAVNIKYNYQNILDTAETSSNYNLAYINLFYNRPYFYRNKKESKNQKEYTNEILFDIRNYLLKH